MTKIKNLKFKINKNNLIFLTGSTGMLGSAILKDLKKKRYKKIIAPNRKQLNLFNYNQIAYYFRKYRPKYLFMIAAKVGGIKDNNEYPLEYLEHNLKIQSNLFKAASKFNVQKCVFIGSSCIYPKKSPQPIKEKNLLNGPLEETNEGYALAKIVGIKTASFYFKKNNMLTICPMICNMYGTNDNYDLEKSHVLSALVRKFVDAKKNNLNKVTLWGSGKEKREFIHVSEASRAIILLFEKFHKNEIVNVGTGTEISIKNLANIIAKYTNYSGEICWNRSMPDGMSRKCLDIRILRWLNFKNKIPLSLGIKKTIKEYKKLNFSK